MAGQKRFIISTTDVKGFDNSTGDLIFETTTLLNSALEQSIQSQSIYGGKGAPKQFQYSYQKELVVNLEDCRFDETYIALNSGVLVENAAKNIYTTETVTLVGGTGSVDGTPADDAKAHVIFPNGAIMNVNFTGQNFSAGTGNETVRVTYLISQVVDNIEIDANKFPSAIKLVMDADLFDASTGQIKIGSVQIVVFNYKIEGNFTLTFDMQTPVTSALNGTALAHKRDGKDIYADISIINEVDTINNQIVGLFVSPNSCVLDLNDNETFQITTKGYRGDGLSMITNPDGVTFVSTNELTCTVDANGLVTPVDVGETTVVASLEVGANTYTDVLDVEVIS